MARLEEEIIIATDELRYSMRKTEQRKDPWLPAEVANQFTPHAVALIELLGNERANEIMSEAVITELGKKVHKRLREEWIRTDVCWIDMCAKALRDAGKEVP